MSSSLAAAGHLAQPFRPGLDHIEHLLAERPDQLAGVDRPDSPDHARAERLLDALDRRRGGGADEPRPEPPAVGTVVDPLAGVCDPLLRCHYGGMADHGDQAAMPARPGSEHAEAVLRIVEGARRTRATNRSRARRRNRTRKFASTLCDPTRPGRRPRYPLQHPDRKRMPRAPPHASARRSPPPAPDWTRSSATLPEELRRRNRAYWPYLMAHAIDRRPATGHDPPTRSTNPGTIVCTIKVSVTAQHHSRRRRPSECPRLANRPTYHSFALAAPSSTGGAAPPQEVLPGTTGTIYRPRSCSTFFATTPGHISAAIDAVLSKGDAGVRPPAGVP